MYQPNSNRPFTHTDPSASDDMSIEIESEGEQSDDSSPHTGKRTRTSYLRCEKNTDTTAIDMSTNSIPNIEMTPDSSGGIYIYIYYFLGINNVGPNPLGTRQFHLNVVFYHSDGVIFFTFVSS